MVKILKLLNVEYDITLKPNIDIASYSLVYEFTKIGLGVGYVTKEYVTKDLENGTLYEIDLEERIPSRFIGIALCKNSVPNFSTKKLIEIINKKK